MAYVYPELGSAPGQFSDDRSEHVGVDGAEDEIGEADLLASPLKLLDGRLRVLREYLQRVRRAKRSRVDGGNRQVRRDGVADHRHLLREFNVTDGTDAEVAYHPCHLAPILARPPCERDRV